MIRWYLGVQGAEAQGVATQCCGNPYRGSSRVRRLKVWQPKVRKTNGAVCTSINQTLNQFTNQFINHIIIKQLIKSM